MTPLERDQAAILTLFTGVICGPVEDAHQLAEVLLGRPVLLHELGSGEVAKQVHELVAPVFEAMAANVAMPDPIWPAPPVPVFDDEFGLTMDPCEHPSINGTTCAACGEEVEL